MIVKALNRSIGLQMSRGEQEKIMGAALKLHWTRDVFDRLIVAEASVLGYGLVTKGHRILENFPSSIW